MIVKYPIQSEIWVKLKTQFSRLNKNLAKEERQRKMKLPRRRYINLWVRKWPDILFPIALFKDKLQKTKDRSVVLNYTGNPSKEQIEVLNTVRDWRRSWLIEMKTWRWKSHIVIWLADIFKEPILIAVHNIGTLQDMVDKFQEFTWYKPWVYYWDKKDIQEITITTHTSFVLAQEEFRWKFWIIIIDECDYWLSNNMLEAIILSDADGIFWLSWTPEKKWLDIWDMEHVFWSHIKVKEQENNWYNLIPEIIRVHYTSKQIYSFWTKWQDLTQTIIDDETRFIDQCTYIISKMKSWEIKYWLLLVERREEECVKYYEYLSKHIPWCVMINGKTKPKIDTENIEMLQRLWWGLIVGTVRKVGRGKDIPMIDWVFLFFPNTFKNSTVQAVWRWLRFYKDKPKCLLIDRCDEPILWYQASARLITYTQEYTDKVSIRNVKFLSVNSTDELFNT